ncbi:hypothetical protein DYU11_25655 [Fibrisoma montanum]|uniref:Thioredoxin-like fold domain-containing protein n=1 Tax=Fibrisoma montanum TaxID=2305895 RepID=A0A418M1K2_9BACT|nr:thioredoxin domain-containing protein [Fibrisoma montanum]RIV19482.1 hypothetical protein DYU11_25655 [Fibrisoma montanum]
MVELIEFGDFMCPGCRKARQPLLAILSRFDSQVNYRYRHFPNRQQSESWLAAVAVEAARRQGKFWPMYHSLFAQRSLCLDNLSALAVQLGLDVNRFLDDLQDERVYHRIEDDQRAGLLLEVSTTPTLVIDGLRFHGGLTQARLIPLIRQHIRRTTAPVLDTVNRSTGQVHWGDTVQ